jgi:hypothetical protein
VCVTVFSSSCFDMTLILYVLLSQEKALEMTKQGLATAELVFGYKGRAVRAAAVAPAGSSSAGSTTMTATSCSAGAAATMSPGWMPHVRSKACAVVECAAAKGHEEVKLLTCGRCQAVIYCGPQHQKLHWPIHKITCCRTPNGVPASAESQLSEEKDAGAAGRAAEPETDATAAGPTDSRVNEMEGAKEAKAAAAAAATEAAITAARLAMVD